MVSMVKEIGFVKHQFLFQHGGVQFDPNIADRVTILDQIFRFPSLTGVQPFKNSGELCPRSSPLVGSLEKVFEIKEGKWVSHSRDIE